MAGRELQYTDVNSNFKAHPVTGDLIVVKGNEAIKQSIKTLLSTKHYERLFQPEIGCSIDQYLFEPMSELNTIQMKRSIETALSTLEPRIELLNVSVLPEPDYNRYTITIVYGIISLNEEYTFTTYLNRES